MNDSFLEDLELIPVDAKQAAAYPVDRHVTTRHATSSPFTQHLPETKSENLIQRSTEHSKLTEKQPSGKESHTKDPKRISEHDTRKQQSKTRVSEKRDKPVESKLKPIENKVKNGSKEQELKDEIKKKLRETRVKVSESKVTEKDRTRRSGSYKENNHSSDVSSKENSRPSDSSKESTSTVEVCKERGRKSDCRRKSDVKETDPVVLLTAVKDIVSTYTKQESAKILRAMQELHMNSQANLIKNLIFQTDDLIKEMHPSKDSARMRTLLEQNERLQENIVILQKKNEDLQKKLEEFEFLKQENISLNLKCKELAKQ